jgi:hypothetical protein
MSWFFRKESCRLCRIMLIYRIMSFIHRWKVLLKPDQKEAVGRTGDQDRRNAWKSKSPLLLQECWCKRTRNKSILSRKATGCFSWQNTKAKFADSSNATKKLCSILKKNGMTNGELNVL